MKANELRIGNYVHSENGIGRITGIEAERVSVDNDKLPYTQLYEIEPITLTEKWLKDFGFRRTSFGMTLNDFYLEAGSRVIKTNELQSFSLEIVPDKKYIETNSVHKLQNIYLDFTGNELERSKPSKETNGN